MSHYVLIIYIITSYGAVNVQRETGFYSYQDCATEAVARVETRTYPDDTRIKWECEKR